MGEAKRYRDAYEKAYAEGDVFKPRVRCPACGGAEVIRMTANELAAGAEPAVVRDFRKFFNCDIELCRSPQCKAIWEAFPAEGYVLDSCVAEPCDNCAFRPGSPEQEDAEEWRSLMKQLRPGESWWESGRFYCHKGVPIDMTKGPGNFLFPQKPVIMEDGDVLCSPTSGEPIVTYDMRRMRLCSGFLRMVQAHHRKLDRGSGDEDRH